MDNLPVSGPVQVLIDWLFYIVSVILSFLKKMEEPDETTPSATV